MFLFHIVKGIESPFLLVLDEQFDESKELPEQFVDQLIIEIWIGEIPLNNDEYHEF
jgi:hypothetical protein